MAPGRPPMLTTQSLEAIELPESILKEWRRRKLGATAAEHPRDKEFVGVRESIAGRNALPAPPASLHAGSKIQNGLRAIKRMVPLDERGIWLLKNLLLQMKPEDQEGLCRSIQDKLIKRRSLIVRFHDRFNLECDRRNVFTEAANKVRTDSATTAKVNRKNVLTTIVEDHLSSEGRSDKKCRTTQPQHSGRMKPDARSNPTYPSFPVSTKRGGTRVLKREIYKEKEASEKVQWQKENEWLKEGHGPKQTGIPTALSRKPAHQVSVGSSCEMVDDSLSSNIWATASRVNQNRSTAGGGGDFSTHCASVVASSPRGSRKRRRKIQLTLPPAQKKCVGSDFNDSGMRLLPLPPRSSIFKEEETSSVGNVRRMPSAVWENSEGHEKQGITWRKAERVRLPSLEERYGVRIDDTWAKSPVALRIGRPRCKSVDIAHLDQPAYKEHMEGVLLAGALVTRQGQKQVAMAESSCCQEQTVAAEYCEGGNCSTVGTKPKSRTQQETRAAEGLYTRVSSNDLPLRKERHGDGGRVADGGDGGHPASCSSFSSILPLGESRKRRLGGSDDKMCRGVDMATAAPTKTNHADLSGSGGTSSKNPVFSASPVSRTQPRGLGEDMFCLTSCDIHELPRTEGSGAKDLDKPHPNPPSCSNPSRSSCRVDSSSDRINGSRTTVTEYERLAWEELRFRSKGARKVFKQTQRLLEALHTPASGCQVTSIGHRRRCGGAKIGGDPSIIVHHHRNKPGKGHVTMVRARGRNHGQVAGEHGNADDDRVPSTTLGLDDGVWRKARGSPSARLAEVFRCIVPPHPLSVECEHLLEDSIGRDGSGQDHDGGTSGSGVGTWDGLVHAWECLCDAVLAGRVLSAHFEEALRESGKNESAADSFLSDGLLRALLSTKCYRPPGSDQRLIEWLDELLEAVRAYVQRACARIPSQYSLAAGLDWYDEVGKDRSFLRPKRNNGGRAET